MSVLHQAVETVVHLDAHIQQWVHILGPWIYTLVFFIILFETGLIVAPFLPGDSLLFALGALTVGESAVLSLSILLVLLSVAAIVGGILNYSIGSFVGPRIFLKENTFWFRKSHLLKTKDFYEKHGGKAVVLARFLPIIRTFVPFVAGIGGMKYSRFLSFNIAGGIGWVVLVTFAGHFFGNIPAVKRNFGIVIPVIIIVSVLPLLIKVGQSANHKRKIRKVKRANSRA